MSTMVTFIGAPCSGKSTLASAVHTNLKTNGKNSVFVGEAATDYIAEFGLPNTPLDQLVIFYKQLEKENMFKGVKDYIICDSSTILGYFYLRNLFPHQLSKKDIATINHVQKEILKTINSWSHIFYVPPFDESRISDGVRYHNREEIIKIDRLIKAYLDMENIWYEDLSKIPISEREKYVANKLMK